MSLTFDLSTSKDLLKLLLEKSNEFKKDKLNTVLAREGAILCWSLCDWVFSEHGMALGFKSLRDLQEFVKNNCISMSYMQDLANSSKHKEITKYIPLLKEAKKHRGAFSRAFSRAFNISSLRLVLQNNTELWFEDELEKATTYWAAFFSSHGF